MTRRGARARAEPNFCEGNALALLLSLRDEPFHIEQISDCRDSSELHNIVVACSRGSGTSK